MPNTFAYIALVIWPVVVLFIFANNTPARALVWSLLAGYLLLPANTEINFPGVPAFTKISITNLSALLGAAIFARSPVIRPPREWWLVALILLYIASPFLTVWGNREPLIIGDTALPGLQFYDAFSAVAYQTIDLIPFVLAYNLLRGPEGQRQILHALVIAALAYSLPMLLEVRLSPQLHTWIYGFFPHSFGQQMRGGGFRPVVFLNHGLMVAIFTALAFVASAYLAKARIKIFGLPGYLFATYLFVVLVLCRSLGALVLASVAVLLLVVVRQRSMRLICAFLAVCVLTYPILRGADVVPVQWVADRTASYSKERAESFQTRIDNENALLARASQKPLFGWGSYGRNRVYDEYTGRDVSITDGTWIIIVGTYGWLGYLAAFGLLCIPVIVASRNRGDVVPATTALSLILVVNLLDLLPNSSLTPLTWLFAGSLVTMRLRRANPTLRPDHNVSAGGEIVRGSSI
jgi:hypothetical protein